MAENTEEMVPLGEASDVEETFELGNSRKYLIVVAVSVVLAVVLVIFVVFPMYQTHQARAATEPEETPVPAEPLGFTYRVSDLTVNPKNSAGRRLAVFEIVFEVADEESIEFMKQNEPVVKDYLINYFRSKSIQELSTDSVMVQGKEELLDVIRNRFGRERVRNMYFTRFILQ